MASNIVQTVRTGDRISVNYSDREFDVIVIDPNGVGDGQPSVGFGFRMGEKYVGMPESTVRGWVRGSSDGKALILPSGKAFRVRDIKASDGNTYSVVEASDWIEAAFDILENPGRTGKSLKKKLISFLRWFTVKGFYAEAYTALKGSYTAKDSRATTRWLNARTAGVRARRDYTDLLQKQGVKSYDYGNWTNTVYKGLFGLSAKKMKAQWALVEGNTSIARNYISEAEGLEAVQYCEDMAVRMFCGDLQEAHELAIAQTLRKFPALFQKATRSA